ncbi:MAG: HAD family phosphatase [Erysipelothrix sp.]|nr:HAD family phosphatase [Erysipelothrix sp.]
MNHLGIKAIVCDIDGTLLTDDKKMLNETKRTLIQAQEAGYKVIIASSRNYFMLEEIVEQLQLARYGGYCITLNGTIVVRCSDRKEWRHPFMAPQLTYDLFEFSKKNHFFTLFESESGLQIYLPKILRWAMPFYYGIKIRKRYLNIRNLNFRIFGDFRFSPNQDIKVVHKSKKLVGPIIKAGFIRLTPGIDKMINKLRDEFENEFDVIRISRVWCDIMPKGMNKAKGLELLQEELGFGLESMIAFGDAENDLTMIEKCQIGVAMGNAFDSLKDVADYVTLSNNANGIAHALRFFELVKVSHIG